MLISSVLIYCESLIFIFLLYALFLVFLFEINEFLLMRLDNTDLVTEISKLIGESSIIEFFLLFF